MAEHVALIYENDGGRFEDGTKALKNARKRKLTEAARWASLKDWFERRKDVKKLFLKTTASGNLPALGGAPVKADAKLDPLVIQAGLLLQF